MEMADPDQFQKILNERDDLDNVCVAMSRYQAQKCAAIVMAGQAGHISYAEASTTVAHFLRAVALDGLPGTPRTSSGDLWEVLDHLPWPRSGPPVEQPI